MDTTIHIPDLGNENTVNNHVRFNENTIIKEIDISTRITRMQIRIPLQITRFPTQWSIEQKLQHILLKVKKVDHNISISPWFSKDIETQQLQNLQIDQIINTPKDKLKLYFPRIVYPPKEKDNFVWLDFALEHHMEWEQIKYNISKNLNKDNYNLYPRQLQTEKEVSIGWLLWSFREIDTDRLANFINKKYQLNVCFRWTTINSGQVNKTNEVKALHVISSQDSQIKAKKQFNMIYHVTKSTFPMGIRMRFVPLLHKIGSNILERVKKCRLDQQGWLKCIQTSYTSTITILDTSYNQTPTLRELIMKLKSKKDNRKLFIGVNKQWNRNDTYCFTYRKEVKEEANAIINTLYLYLKSTTGYKYCDKYFTSEAMEASEDQIWDPINKEVIQAFEIDFQGKAIDNDIEYLGIKSYIDYEVDDNKSTNTHNMKVFLGQENSSIATFSSNNIDDLKSIGTSQSEIKDSDNDTIKSDNKNEDNNVRKEINNLINKVTLLDANFKNKNNSGNEEIIGRLLVLENLIAEKNTSTNSNTSTNNSTSQTQQLSTEDLTTKVSLGKQL
jgi:hypothetical protein